MWATASDVVVYTAPVASGSTFKPLPTTVVDGSHVSATTSHFCIFAPAVAAPSGDAAADDAETLDAAPSDASVDAGPEGDASAADASDASVADASDASVDGDATVDAAVDAEDGSLATDVGAQDASGD